MKIRRYIRLPFTLKVKQINGGNGFERHLMKNKRSITWEIFEDEIRIRFGPSDAKDFDEALS